MNFGAPAHLLLLWLIPALVLLLIWAANKKRAQMARLAEADLLHHLLPPGHTPRTRTRATLILLALSALILALAQPRWGYTWEELTRKGVDIVVVVDVSQSMLATDTPPNRLERAKRELQDLLGMLKGDRVALVAFSGSAFLQCPLTLDYGAFHIFLDVLDPQLIPTPGTALGEAVREGLRAFDPTNPNGRAMIIITDGEDHQGDPLAAAQEAAEMGVRLYTIGMGDESGAPIPHFQGSGFLKDPRGNMILSKLDEATLQRMAVETGGTYVRSTTGDLDLDTIYTRGIRREVETQELTTERRKKWEARYQWPLGLAIVLLLLESLLASRAERPAQRPIQEAP